MKQKTATVLFIVFSLFPLWAKYHPEIKWKEISQEKFIIIYPAGYHSEAAKVLENAKTIHRELRNLWGTSIEGKIRILITDTYDTANGSASFFPFNQITIDLSPPPPDTAYGNAIDWIRLVLSHELSHLFYLNSGSKFIRSLRDIFGHNPLLYPMNFTPFWMIEGMAVFGESSLNANGRMNSPDYEIILKNMARTKSVPKWRDIYGEPTYWPGPASKYIFGSQFIQFLIDEYGREKIPQLVHHYSKYLITFSSSHRIKQFFKKSLRRLWNEFIDHVPVPDVKIQRALQILTRNGMSKKYPDVIGPERGIYMYKNYQDFPGVWEINFKTLKQEKLFEKDNINDLSFSPEEQTITFSALDYFKSYYQYSDLYEYKLKENLLQRLSYGQRLFSPVRLPGSDKIICVKRKRNKSYLCLFDKETGKETILSQAFSGIFFLSLSPDHQTIAASLKRETHNWEIALFNLDGTLRKIISPCPGKKYYPRWKSHREIYFICQNSQHYRLASYDLDTDQAYLLAEKTLPSIRHFTFMSGNQSVLINYFDSGGYNLGILDLQGLPWQPIPSQHRYSLSEALPEPGPLKEKKYHFWRDLLPKSLNFNFRYAGNEIQPGVLFFGNDAILRHSISFQGFYGVNTDSINFNFNYTYEGIYPTLILNLLSLTDLNMKENNEEYTYTTKTSELVMLFPLALNEKSQFHLYANLHSEKIIEQYESPEADFRLKLNGIKLGFLYNSAKHYYDSISNADGISLSLTYSMDFDFLGSDFNLNTLAFEYKQYVSLLRPNVLALRLGINNTWGDGDRTFYMGGADSKLEYHIAGGNLFNLMRGYPSGYFSGAGGFIMNLEYRVSLVKMERSIFISKRVERFYLSFFADIGNMWEEKIKLNPALSVGAELNMVIFLGKRVNVSGGVAIGRYPYHEPIFYVRVGEAF